MILFVILQTSVTDNYIIAVNNVQIQKVHLDAHAGMATTKWPIHARVGGHMFSCLYVSEHTRGRRPAVF